MSETFCVDTTALGNIPALLERVHGTLARTSIAEPAATAAGAAPGGAGIARFAASLAAFIAAGDQAIASDVAQIRDAVENYRTCDLEVAEAAARLSRRAGASGSW